MSKVCHRGNEFIFVFFFLCGVVAVMPTEWAPTNQIHQPLPEATRNDDNPAAVIEILHVRVCSAKSNWSSRNLTGFRAKRRREQRGEGVGKQRRVEAEASRQR